MTVSTVTNSTRGAALFLLLLTRLLMRHLAVSVHRAAAVQTTEEVNREEELPVSSSVFIKCLFYLK